MDPTRSVRVVGPCPTSRAINLLQDKWVLHIVRTLLDGPRGFNDLGRAVGGCNTTTLAQRLDRLESLEIVRKTVHSVMPPKTSYGLTSRGRGLDRVIRAIDRWACRHLAADRASRDATLDGPEAAARTPRARRAGGPAEGPPDRRRAP